MRTTHSYRSSWGLLLAVCLVTAGHAAVAAPSSAYTDLTKCKLTDSSAWHKDAEIDFFKSTCPSFAGHRIRHDGGDARSWLVIDDWDARTDLLRQVPGSFHQIVGKAIEWRSRAAAQPPYAFIVRVAAQDDAAMKDLEWLVVGRLAPLGLVGAIKASGNPKANVEAQALADRYQ